jgi:D-glycero-beta-D-manno-heptose 1-phosphate adenylyltransferase
MTENKISTLEQLLPIVSQWKAGGEKIVFTNGCFDILHLGHIDYLEKAAQKGTKLIVAINTDQSVSKIKGPNRPIQTEYARARMLAALSFVDAVTFFNEETPQQIINQILPAVLIKGNDYEIENIVGSDIVMRNGGKVETIQLVSGYSTTKIIEKIKNT